MAAPTERSGAAALQQAYAEIARQMKAQDHAKVLKAVNKTIELQRNDSNLEHAKAIALIRLDRYEDAEKIISNFPNTEFEKAYCEYRLQRPTDALRTLSVAAVSSNRRNKELLGQLLYRLEKYDESSETYTEMLKDASSASDSDVRDRKANHFGTLAAAALWADRIVDIPSRGSSNNDSYSTLYNEACAHIGMQRFNDAVALLDRAERMCIRQLEEDGYSAEELDSELAYFRVQRGYIAMRRAEIERAGNLQRESSENGESAVGKPSGEKDEVARRFEEEASRLFNTVLKLKTTGANDVDQQLVAIAANNLICLNREANLFDSRKKAKLLQAETLANKLVLAQRYATFFNQSLVYFFSNQPDQCRKALGKLTEMRQADGSLPLPDAYKFAELRLQVALAAREKQPSKAIDALQAFIAEKTAGKDACINDSECAQQFVGACLLLVELLVAEGRMRDAIEGLLRVAGSSDSQPFNMAVFTRLLALYDASKDFDAAHSYIFRTIRSYRGRLRGGELTKLLTVIMQFYTKHRRVEEATRVLDELAIGDALQNVSPDSLANLLGVFARFSIERAERMIRQLPPVTQKRVDEIAAKHSFDLDALETAFQYGQRAFSRKVTTVKQDGTSKPRDETAKEKKRNKKRKKRLPKNLNPNVPPDPERWLPKRERSTYKAKMARRDKRRGTEMRVGGTQGAIIRDRDAASDPQQSTNVVTASSSASVKAQSKLQSQPQPSASLSSAPSSSSTGSAKPKKSGKKRH